MSETLGYKEFNTIIYTNVHNPEERSKVSLFFPARTIAPTKEFLENTMVMLCTSLTQKACKDLNREDIFFDYIVFTTAETVDFLTQLDELFGEGEHPYGRTGERYH